MATPIITKAEVAWGADLAAAPGTWTWTDITTDVRPESGASIRVGRGDEDQETSTTESTFAVNDPLGKFIPRNPLGPNWPYVRQNTPFRLSFASGVRTIVYADSYAPSWDESLTNPVVTISASGIMRRLDHPGGNPHSAIFNGVTKYTPTPLLYLPLEDADGATVAASGIVGGITGTVTGTVKFGEHTSVPVGTAPLPDFSSGGQISANIPPPEVSIDNTWTMECAFAGPSTVPAADIAVMRWFTYNLGHIPGGSFTLVAGFSPPRIYVSGGPSLSFNVADLFDGNMWHVRVVADQPGGAGTTTWTLYLDDVAVATNTSGSSPGIRPGGVLLNNGSTDGYTGNIVSIGHVAAYSGALVAGGFRNRDHGRALQGYPGEPVSDRVAAVCAENGIPVTISGSSSTTMGPQPIGTPLNLLRLCETADIGILSDGATNGGLTYLARGGRYNLTPAFVLSTATLSPPFRPVEDDQRRRNDWTISRRGGSQAEVVDTAGPEGSATVGLYDDSKSINVATDGELGDQAAWRVRMGTVEQMRYPSVVLNLRAHPELAAAWQAAAVGARFTMNGLPSQHGPGDVDQVIEGWAEFCDGFEWLIAVNAGPYDPWRVNKIGDAALGRLDTGGSALAQAAAPGATSLTVATSLDPVWTTTAVFGADFPFDVSISGIQVAVSAIASAALDAFGRTVSNGWGSADSGQAYTTSGGAASDFSVGSGTGKQAANSVNVFRSSALDIGSTDFDYTVDLNLSVNSASGATITTWLTGRYSDANNYYVARVDLSTAANMSIMLAKRVSGTLTTIVSNVTVGANTSATTWRVRFRGVGDALSAKLWVPASAAEPAGWTVAGSGGGSLSTGTQVALLSRLETGNTNTLPVTFSFDNLAVTNPQKFTVSGVAKALTAGAAVKLWKPGVIAL